MRKNMPYMVLDITKKPGDPNAVKTGEMLLAENTKMREALVKCREIALQWQADEAAGVAGTTDKPHARSAAEAVIDMEFEINAALSTPPRNCDLPKVVEDPCRAWLDDESNWEDGYPKLEIHDWLLASATEKEGGDK